MVCLPTFIENAISVTYFIGVTDDVIVYVIFHYYRIFNGKIDVILSLPMKMMPNTKYKFYDIHFVLGIKREKHNL